MRSFLLLSLLLLAAGLSARAQDPTPAPPESPEWTHLKASAEAFVKAYNAHDAEALAALVTPDAEMLRDDGTRISGRGAIEEFYRDVFRQRPEVEIALEATSVRFLTPGLAIEDGAVHVTEAADGESASFLYTALHARQEDGSWLLARTRDREVTGLAAHEALADVDGLVGDWIARTDGGALKMSFTWDRSGSYLLGNVTYTATGLEPSTITMRIGWDSVRGRIVSWMFDSAGGHSKAEWTDAGDHWIVKADGYTGDGEITSSTQLLKPTSDDSFTWAVTDKIIAGEIQPDRSLHVVRQPPKPKFSNK